MTPDKIHITQGEWAVGSREDQVISTILGSCVSCCLWDPVAGVGGMNHMLLTISTAGSDPCNLAGINAMELLINDILKQGGRRDRLRAKAFGGARMVEGLSGIGQANCDFTLDFLAREGIHCEGQSLGGDTARHVMFWPATGRALLKVRTDQVIAEERPMEPQTEGNDLELF